jgi:hypothetical protein
MGAYRAAAAALLILIASAASAADCSTALRAVSSRSSNPNLVNGPMAWSGSVIAVAKTQEGASGAVWASFYDENLQNVAPDRLYATNAREIYGIVWTGAEFGLLYRTSVPSLLLQRLTMLGDPIGAPIAVTPSRTIYASDELDFVWSSALDAYVVARVVSQGGSKGLWITVLEEDGTQRTDRQVPVVLSNQSQLQIAVTNSGVIGAVFINVNDSLVFARMDTSGPIIANTLSTTAGTSLNMAAHQERFVVTRAVAGVEKTNIRWMVVDTSNQIVRPDAVLVEAPELEVLPRALISNGTELALSYVASSEAGNSLDDVFRLLRFTANGTVIADTPFSSDISAGRATTDWRFVWTGSAYIAAPVRSSADRLTSYLTKVCPLQVEIIGPRNILVGSTVTFSPNASGGVPPYEYVWSFSTETRTDRGEVMVRTFNQTGTYIVSVTVTDSAGAQATATTNFDVVEPDPPPPPVKPRRRAVRP